MKIGMLGTGAVGQTVGTRLVAMGHDVMMGARAADNEKVLGFAQRTGGKAGTFAEGAARVVAQAILAQLRGEDPPERHLGRGTCYIEFGQGRIGSVDIDFLSGPEKTGTFNPPSAEQMALKESFGSTRRARWFALQ